METRLATKMVAAVVENVDENFVVVVVVVDEYFVVVESVVVVVVDIGIQFVAVETHLLDKCCFLHFFQQRRARTIPGVDLERNYR